MVGSRESIEIYNNLINPAVSDSAKKANDTTKSADGAAPETGYKSSERTALENQLLQIETAARAAEARDATNPDIDAE